MMPSVMMTRATRMATRPGSSLADLPPSSFTNAFVGATSTPFAYVSSTSADTAAAAPPFVMVTSSPFTAASLLSDPTVHSTTALSPVSPAARLAACAPLDAPPSTPVAAAPLDLRSAVAKRRADTTTASTDASESTKKVFLPLSNQGEFPQSENCTGPVASSSPYSVVSVADTNYNIDSKSITPVAQVGLQSSPWNLPMMTKLKTEAPPAADSHRMSALSTTRRRLRSGADVKAGTALLDIQLKTMACDKRDYTERPLRSCKRHSHDEKLTEVKAKRAKRHSADDISKTSPKMGVKAEAARVTFCSSLPEHDPNNNSTRIATTRRDDLYRPTAVISSSSTGFYSNDEKDLVEKCDDLQPSIRMRIRKPKSFTPSKKQCGNIVSFSWRPRGKATQQLVYLTNDAKPVRRECYASIEHVAHRDERANVGDCVLVASDASQYAVSVRHVAKLCRFFVDPSTRALMATVLWYYKAEQLEDDSVRDVLSPHRQELFASRHIDVIPVDCIEEFAYVLTYNEYNR